ncbi:MAG: hypothetical protein RLZZ234_362 [Candidatus Parcubacteria bacterium]|jgi:hypothetical protein
MPTTLSIDTVHIRSVEELIRHVLLKDVLPVAPVSLYPDQVRAHVGVHQFIFEAGVIDRAIADGWILRNDDDTRFQFNYARVDEWQADEEARIEQSLARLRERNIRARYDNRCGEWRHPECMDHNMRGFIFVDDKRNQYLVAEGGAIIPVPHLIVI